MNDKIKRWTAVRMDVLYDGKSIIRLGNEWAYPDYTSHQACSLAFLFHAAEVLADALNKQGAKP